MSTNARRRPHRPGWLYRWMMAWVGLFDRWLHLSCRSFIRRASEQYERPLNLGERLGQALHRAICRLCRLQEQRMGQLRSLAHELGRDTSDVPGIELSAEAAERIRRAMAAAAGGSTPHSGDPDPRRGLD